LRVTAIPYQAFAAMAMQPRSVYFTRMVIDALMTPVNYIRVLITTHVVGDAMTETFTAFLGERRLASGPLADVVRAVKRAGPHTSEPIAVFSDATGGAIDLDLRGSEDEALARLPTGAAASSTDPSPQREPRGRGRPRLGVVAREVTLLPRHWEWLNGQPGGASVALRRLVDEARGTHGDRDRRRAARDAAYHFMSAIAGNRENFEEASRALFADDRRRLESQIASWPSDIGDHVVKLAFGEHGELIA
jgi:hypothetical protein